VPVGACVSEEPILPAQAVPSLRAEFLVDLVADCDLEVANVGGCIGSVAAVDREQPIGTKVNAQSRAASYGANRSTEVNLAALKCVIFASISIQGIRVKKIVLKLGASMGESLVMDLGRHPTANASRLCARSDRRKDRHPLVAS